MRIIVGASNPNSAPHIHPTQSGTSHPIPHPCLFRVYLFIFLCAFYFEGSQSIERKAKVLAFSSHTLECCRSVVMMCMGWFGWMEIDDDSSVRSLFCCCLLCVPTVFKQSNRWCSTHRTISITVRTTHLSLHMLFFSCQLPSFLDAFYTINQHTPGAITIETICHFPGAAHLVRWAWERCKR